MKKRNFIIGIVLAIAILFAGCVPASVEGPSNTDGVPTFQMVFPKQADVIGAWTIDTAYTKEFTGKEMQELYGTAFGSYGCGMEFGADGSFSYFIAAGTGGEGTYIISETDKYISVTLTDNQSGQQSESVIRVAYINDQLRLLQEEGKELIVWKKQVESATATTDSVPTPEPTPTPTPTPTPAPTPSPEWQIAGFPIVYQNPELPTGCEITALTMVLNYYGYDVDKMTMANQYLPTTKIGTWKGKDGVTYGPDLYNYFAGNPAGTGITCGAGAIRTAANGYLEAAGSDLRAVDISGTPVHELYAYVSQNIPVFLCATIGMEDRRSIKDSWYTEEGELMDWSTNDHGVVLIGYTKTEVTVADPINGRVTCTREQFERVYEQRGRQAVVLTVETQNAATLG